MAKIPDSLKAGDVVGIVAPAGGFDRDKFDRGVEIITSMGFNVKYPGDLFDARGYLSAPDEIRAAHLNTFFADPEINAVLCARGGYGSIRLLPRLDFDLIRKHPKVFMGFSDISVLLAAFYGKCGLACFHGPMAATLPDMDEVSINAMVEALTFPDTLDISLNGCHIIRPGKVSGPVAGGNLTTLSHLMGTDFQPDWEGHILFLEDTQEALYRIDRMANHLKLAGCFAEIRGLILGSFDGCGGYPDIIHIFKGLLKGMDIPMVAQFPAGHGGRNLTIPMGIPAVLDTEKLILVFRK
jgi:muramoyltetrapeptide carboxypeptidase